MASDDIKKMSEFLDEKIKYSDGYCIAVSDDMRSAKIYFAVTEKVFDVKIEKLRDIKYSMSRNDRKRVFEVVNVQNDNDRNATFLEWFFEDNNKYNLKKGSYQNYDGINFYDICVSSTQYDCSVEGCIKRIGAMDKISDAEAEGPLGVE